MHMCYSHSSTVKTTCASDVAQDYLCISDWKITTHFYSVYLHYLWFTFCISTAVLMTHKSTSNPCLQTLCHLQTAYITSLLLAWSAVTTTSTRINLKLVIAPPATFHKVHHVTLTVTGLMTSSITEVKYPDSWCNWITPSALTHSHIKIHPSSWKTSLQSFHIFCIDPHPCLCSIYTWLHAPLVTVSNTWLQEWHVSLWLGASVPTVFSSSLPSGNYYPLTYSCCTTITHSHMH